MEEPLVSIVMPGYNREYIAVAVESAINQTYRNKEIIVVDDGSPNNIREVLAPYIDSGAIKYVWQENKKMAGAKNTGIRHAKGSLIAFLDDDDVFFPEKLAKQVPCFDDPKVGLVYCWPEGIRQGKVKPVPERCVTYDGMIFDRLITANFITSSAVVVRKACLDAVGVFNESPGYRGVDDADLWTRICHKYAAKGVSEILLQIRDHEHSFSRNRAVMAQNLLNMRKDQFRDLDVPKALQDRFYAYYRFQEGWDARKRDKLRALRLYLQSFRHQPSLTPLLAAAKLLAPVTRTPDGP